MDILSIIHWNDVYRVSPQKLTPHSSETIDTAQFAAVLDDIRSSWTDLADGKKNGLVLFSGDVFSPSVESSVTRGSHMVPVMNLLAPDASLTGNHDFDFGYPHLSKLIQDTTFPWILSNIIDSDTSQVPECLHEYQIFDRAGIKIGVIGLVEKEWITTVATWPSTFIYKDMAKTGLDLSRRLRTEHQCDLIIALTHSRVPNDISLAKSLQSLSPSAQEAHPVSSSHGVDIILGGHDHLYFVSKGVSTWEGYDFNEVVLGAEEDQGDVLIVKSGTDFRELSELNLELKDTSPGSVRRKVIKRVTGKRHKILPECKTSEPMQRLLKTLLSSVSDTMKAPVCKITTTIDCRSQFIRTAESAAGNLFADIIRHAYDQTLCIKGRGGSDGVLICAGTLRGDSTYGPGVMTLGNILEILPFEDPTVVLELDGAAIWDALESSLSTWPAQEGRFPVISGFRVSWDSRREPGNRVLGVWTLLEKEESIAGSQSLSGFTTPELIDGEPITKDGKQTYKIVTRDYMAQGHDGFLALKGKTYLVDDESGQLMSSIVRKYFLGSHFVNMMASQMSNLSNPRSRVGLRPRTEAAVSRETARRRTRKAHEESVVAEHWKRAAKLAVQWSRRSRLHYQDQLSICTTEHMSPVDAYDGQSIRREGQTRKRWTFNEEEMITVHPEIDGRLKDIAKT
ncbi:Trifunctional nucleotide phosphoesterase protein YfkN [Termitomyces sp. T112]|nr:Trifunctional nucleotide phosphoesterase protein YfkN [Termitomyces sp. T112]